MMVTVSQMAEGVAQPEARVKVQISDRFTGQRTRKQIGCDWQDQLCNSQGPVQMKWETLIQDLLRTSRQRQQRMKPRSGPCKQWGPG